MDECGICGGSGDSCALALTLRSDTLAPVSSATNTSLVSCPAALVHDVPHYLCTAALYANGRLSDRDHATTAHMGFSLS